MGRTEGLGCLPPISSQSRGTEATPQRNPVAPHCMQGSEPSEGKRRCVEQRPSGRALFPGEGGRHGARVNFVSLVVRRITRGMVQHPAVPLGRAKSFLSRFLARGKRKEKHRFGDRHSWPPWLMNKVKPAFQYHRCFRDTARAQTDCTGDCRDRSETAGRKRQIITFPSITEQPTWPSELHHIPNLQAVQVLRHLPSFRKFGVHAFQINLMMQRGGKCV